MRPKSIKQKHGKPNPILEAEERMMLAAIDRALATGGNAQTIGQSGELPLQSFLTRHLPNTLTARSGHFVSPSGRLSPQIDILILDSRYPLLAENDDGSVLAMMHSVLCCIEVKTNIRASEVARMHGNSKAIIALAEGAFAATRSFENPSCLAFAYRTAGRLETLVGEGKGDRLLKFCRPASGRSVDARPSATGGRLGRGKPDDLVREVGGGRLEQKNLKTAG